MHEPIEALAFLENERQSGSEEWYNSCERLCRTSYALEAHYTSANLHYDAVPTEHRFGHETPSPGDLAIMKNSGSGHIVVCTGVGWACYTNDYGGHGKVVKIPDLRVLVPWSHATEWYIADAWWSEQNFKVTHQGADMPLTPNEISAIADAVWAKQLKRAWDDKNDSAGTMLGSAQRYAIEGGFLGTNPKSNGPTTASQILAAAKDDTEVPADIVDKIATAVADKLAARLQA